MADERRDRSAPSPAAPRAGQGVLLTLVAVGALAVGWAVFLWRQLFAARAGGVAFCGFGGDDCAALWDGGFATWVHGASGLPVAGWGVVWGIAATLLPLAALLVPDRAVTLAGASRWAAMAGLAGVAALVAVLAGAGAFCGACAVFYGIVVVYAAVALWKLPPAPATRAWQVPATAAATFLAAWLVLLWPGSATPHADAGDRAVAAAVGAAAPGAPATDDPATADAPAPPPAAPATREEKAELLRQFLTNLDPQSRQTTADLLALYAAAEPHDPAPPEGLIGDPSAPVILTEFSDTFCDHCARFHVSVAQMKELLPPASFAVEPRHFPLDGNCNPHLPVRGPETMRCLAARARICMEELGDEVEFSAALYGLAQRLTEKDVYAIAEQWTDAATLRECIASPETTAELREDVDYAQRYGIEGTPLVLLDGRQVMVAPPLVLALILAEGDADHPAFELLPPPQPIPVAEEATVETGEAG